MGVFPAANTLATAHVSPSDYGAAQGVMAAARTLAEAAAPSLFGWLLEQSHGTEFPGMPFLLAAGCVGAALLVCLCCIDEPAPDQEPLDNVVSDQILCTAVSSAP